MDKLRSKILIIGDSLALPRTNPEVVNVNETWPYLLRNEQKFDVFSISIGGATIKTLFEQAHYYKDFKPDYIVLQTGIVDCAPRSLGILEKDIINSSWILRHFFHRFFPYHFFRKYRNITYTKLKNYINFLNHFQKIFLNSKIICIGIVPATAEYELIVPGIKKKIILYNEALAEICNDTTYNISTEDFPIDGIMSDHHHINQKGHRWVCDQIVKVIKNS